MDATVGTEQSTQLYANNEERSIVDVLDLAVNLKIVAAAGSPLLQHRGHAAENSCSTRSSPELSINSPVYLQDALVTRPSSEAPFRVTSSTDALGETIFDVQDLAANLEITAAVGSPVLQHRRHAAENSCSTRCSPELIMNSAVYLQDVQLVIGPPSEAPFRVISNTTSLIDALDLAVDRRVTAAVLQQRPIRRSQRFRSRSSPELRIQSPAVCDSVKTAVPPVPAEYPTARSVDRRRSAWKRTKRFVWKSLVNMARRVCFCQTFADVE
ncbi:uncharacterized protein LOC132952977 [Metopolophium dirhodum]|uniref:uncharacterized protein LOC132952977 n=1 Tax=Metopolophium dirhodum TaxID=44670 RepID=UPI00298FAA3F|nr:uncharacterized protein LOC132952977 [Metopolophium dirhodum]